MYVLIIIIILFLLYILSTVCRKGHRGLSTLRGWNYAHRGLHGHGVPENSIAAFRKALESGYGSELDVHLLADGQLAVIHDSLLKRTTGAEGQIENLNAAQLDDYHLEGTTQTIPLLTQVLDIYAGKAPLIVELKPTVNNVDALCRRTCEIMDDYPGAYCIESFDPRCVHWFRKHRPDIIRGQLTENFFATPDSKLPMPVKFLMKTLMFNFLTRPDFIAYRFRDRNNLSNFLCRKLWGVQGVAWTLENMDEYNTAVKENLIAIFEGFCP